MFTPFGFFLLLAFAAAYITFRMEYRHREAAGIIQSFAGPARVVHPVIWGLLGFAAGAKLVYWWLHRSLFIGTPQDFIFSTRGNWIAGLVAGLVVWFIARRQSPASGGREPMHPYQLMDYLLLYCGLFGFGGAILFATLEGHFTDGRLFNGLNYYGALIAGALTYLYINKRYGIRPAIAADIGSPGMMLAYAVGRMGCHVAGDGDWGIINDQPRPAWLPQWLWASYYPHNSVHQGIYIPGCTGSHCTILQAPVFPTPLYEAIICFCLFLLLWRLRRSIKKPGILFAYFAILNGAERFFIEFIRINPRYHIGYWKLSQAQLLALGWLFTGLIVLLLSARKTGIRN
ncbi:MULTISPECIES: prolipoprotein diacylglyceryl transferase [Niastella]|uniref:Prolipoprotein diacylglyceryl transferase n=1 Tax=Niastella soli TaxID=2821487 RepID=A0ABS3YX96_9BACT|nr:prolipoprotein diacylglyceryl transferase family protein [Niastella soli]MBO9202464.1 prolipoprotein diacylglyceryl transferase [Niastella soli]